MKTFLKAAVTAAAFALAGVASAQAEQVRVGFSPEA